MSRPDGGPAFPDQFRAAPGMSLRDWLAGQAITGILANPQQKCTSFPFDYVFEAYRVADAMLAEREKANE